MNPEWIVKIEVPLTTTHADGKIQYSIGTGYPIQHGLVLTARHVLYHKDMNQAGKRILSWRHSDEDAPYHQVTIQQEQIVFEDEKFDIAVLKCDTQPLALPLQIISSQFPQAKQAWKSMGYPRAGKVGSERIKTSAHGEFYQPDTHYYVQQLTSEGNATESILWKGMSGAPVFHCASGKLVGVLIRTPEKYQDSNKDIREVFQDRLIATSLPYLLQHDKCEPFRRLMWQPRPSQLVPEVLKQDSFKKYLIKQIKRLLQTRTRDTVIWCEQLARELDLDKPEQVETIASALVRDAPEKAIEILSVATEDCVVVGGTRHSEIEKPHELKLQAQELLGWLVLGSVDETCLADVTPYCLEHDALFFTLAVRSLTGVEVVMARRFNRRSDFEPVISSEQKSRFLIKLPEGALTWDEKESARKLFIELWNQVFPMEKLDKNATPKADAWKRLNAELKKLRSDSRKPKHYYISLKTSDYEHERLADYVKQVYQQFLSQLDQMTVIQYGVAGQNERLFVIQEEDLQATINGFFRSINSE